MTPLGGALGEVALGGGDPVFTAWLGGAPHRWSLGEETLSSCAPQPGRPQPLVEREPAEPEGVNLEKSQSRSLIAASSCK